MPVIECLNGEEILLDPTEYEKAKPYKWRIDSTERGQIAVTIFNGKKYSLSRLVFGLTKGQYLFRKDSSKLDFRGGKYNHLLQRRHA